MQEILSSKYTQYSYLSLALLVREQIPKIPTLGLCLAQLAWETSGEEKPTAHIQRLVNDAYFTALEQKQLFISILDFFNPFFQLLYSAFLLTAFAFQNCAL